MVKLTALETAVMKATLNYCNYDSAEKEKADNAVLFNAEDLAKVCGKEVASVKGAMGSLHKKGLMIEMAGGEKGATIESCLTDEGVDVAYGLETKEPFIFTNSAGKQKRIHTPKEGTVGHRVWNVCSAVQEATARPAKVAEVAAALPEDKPSSIAVYHRRWLIVNGMENTQAGQAKEEDFALLGEKLPEMFAAYSKE